MAAVRYTALRSLSTGHTLGGVYILGLALSGLDRQTRPIVYTSEAMSGDTYGLLLRSRVLWVCETGPVRQADADRLREFLDSCEGKERFEFAPYDGAASPSPRWRFAVLDGQGYKEQRVALQPGGGEADWFQFSFTAREVP